MCSPSFASELRSNIKAHNIQNNKPGKLISFPVGNVKKTGFLTNAIVLRSLWTHWSTPFCHSSMKCFQCPFHNIWFSLWIWIQLIIDCYKLYAQHWPFPGLYMSAIVLHVFGQQLRYGRIANFSGASVLIFPGFHAVVKNLSPRLSVFLLLLRIPIPPLSAFSLLQEMFTTKRENNHGRYRRERIYGDLYRTTILIQ